jgi:hypothetical protein
VKTCHAAAFALFLCGLSTTLLAQTTPDTFTSPDEVFRFNAGALIRCTEEAQRGVWDPQRYCFTYIPICDGTLVCFAYPFGFERFGVAAAFSVSEITKVTTEKECLSRSLDWTHDPPENGELVMINHARFQLFHTSDLGTGHVAEGRESRGKVLRTKHKEHLVEPRRARQGHNPKRLEGAGCPARTGPQFFQVSEIVRCKRRYEN